MKKAALIAIGGGGLSAAASMAGLFGSPGGFVLAYLAPLPLLMVGLGLGPAAALVAALTGVAGVALLGGITSAGVYGGMHAFPSWLVVRQAMIQSPSQDGSSAEWYPVGSVLCWLAVLVAAAALLIVFSIVGGSSIESSISDFLRPYAATLAEVVAGSDAQRFQVMFLDYLVPIIIGLWGVSWLILVTVNGVLGQWLLAQRGWAIRPTPRWSDLTLPDWISWLLVAAAAATVFGSGDLEYLALNLVIIFAVPFFFLGLAVVHKLVRPLSARGFVLAAFYFTLIVFFMAFAGAAVAGLGVIEQWVGIRSRLAKAGPTQRSE